MPQTVTSSDPCPRCQHLGQHENYLKNREGTFGTFCDGGHMFQDTADMLAEIKVAKARFGVQTPVPEPVPEPEVNPTPEEPAEPKREFQAKVVVISQEDQARIEELLGQKFTGGGDLFGALWSLKQEVVAAKGQAESVQAQQVTDAVGLTLAPGQVIVTIPEFCREAFKDFAADGNIPLSVFANQQFESYLESLYAAPPAPVS